MSLRTILTAAISFASTTLLFSAPTNAQYEDDLIYEDLYSRSAALDDMLFDDEHFWARDIDTEDLLDMILARDDTTSQEKPKKKLSYAPSSVISPLEPFKTGGKKLPHFLNPTSLCPDHKLVCVHAGKGSVRVPGLGRGDYRVCPTCGKYC